jgi:hypothetical protein
MKEQDIQLLKDNDHRTVRLHMDDGEVVTAKVLFVSETEEDVIVQLISSTKLERYEKSDVQPALQYLFMDIKWVEALDARAESAEPG